MAALIFALTIASTPNGADAAPPRPEGFVVDSVVDAHDGNPGDGLCLTASSDALGTEPLIPEKDLRPDILIGKENIHRSNDGNRPNFEEPPYGPGELPAPGQGPLDSLLIPKCTLRAAIEESNALTNTPTIFVPGDIGTYELSGVALCVCKPGGETLITALDPKNPPVIDGGGRSRVFHITSDAGHATIESVIIRNGNAFTYGGGGVMVLDGKLTLRNSVVEKNVAAFGGGIHVSSYYPVTGGKLVLEDSAVRQNHAGLGGSVTEELRGHGGGIALDGWAPVAEIVRSSIYDNEAERGGALSVSDTFAATLSVENSSIVGNRALGNGGAIDLRPSQDGVTVSFAYTTITDNVAGLDPALDGSLRNGGGIYASELGDIVMSNSILAGNREATSGAAAIRAPDCHAGFNYRGRLISRNSIIGVSSPTTCPIRTGYFGSLTAPFDPRFGPREMTGHQVWYPLDSGSVAIDGANHSSDGRRCPDVDQLGAPRPAGKACDIGAIEMQ